MLNTVGCVCQYFRGARIPSIGCSAHDQKDRDEVRGITIRHLQVINAQRALKWHNGSEPWNPMEWGCAMAGEVGEACNLAKKLRRQESGIHNKDSRGEHTNEEYRRLIGKELADAVIYAVLFADEVSIDLQESIREVFNKKSVEGGFPERL